MSSPRLSGLDREFESLFRSQVRELESETPKALVRQRAITRELPLPLREETTPSVSVRQPRSMRVEKAPSMSVREQRPVRELEVEEIPVRAPLPKFKRNLVESRRAMRGMQRVASTSFAAALSANIPMTILVASTAVTTACVAEDDGEDLGVIGDGKEDAALIDVSISVPKKSSTGAVGVRNYVVHASSAFDVSLAYDGDQTAKVTVTNLDTGVKVESAVGARPMVSVAASANASFKIRVENHSTATLRAKLKAVGHGGGGVSAELVAAARANLDRVAKEIDYTHMQNYGLSGSLTDQFMTALSAEYQTQHPDQYAARVRALASMAFFALPDVMPPADGLKTPFHGLDMTQFDALISVEDQVFSHLVQVNNNDTNGVRPFSVCETRFIIETYVRPHVAYPGFDGYKAAYTSYAASCPQKDKDEWYNFRGLGGLRPSWVESNLADRFLRRMAKHCQSPSDGVGRGVREVECRSSRLPPARQPSARRAASCSTRAADEQYLIEPDELARAARGSQRRRHRRISCAPVPSR